MDHDPKEASNSGPSVPGDMPITPVSSISLQASVQPVDLTTYVTELGPEETPNPAAASNMSEAGITGPGLRTASSGPSRVSDPELGIRSQETSKTGRRHNKVTHFIGVKVSNPEIHRKILEVQEQMQQSYPDLEHALVRLPSLHVTLGVIKMETEEDTRKGKKALRESGNKIKKLFKSKPIDLTVRGLGTFGDTVIFAKVQSDLNLQLLDEAADIVRKEFMHQGIRWPDKRRFNPHITVAKLSRDEVLRHKFPRGIPRDCYNASRNRFFGVQCVAGMDLLKLSDDDDDHHEDYYECLESYNFHNCTHESTDHSRCCDLWRAAQQKH